MVSSDIFITLRYVVFTCITQLSYSIPPRVYAVTRKNKILAVYLGTLVLARLIISLASTFIKHPKTIDIYAYPIDAFNMCVIITDLRPMSFPNSIGTVFGTSSICSSFWRKMLRVTDREEHLELSAFLAILWYTYRDQKMLKFSGLIRTLVGEATIYFLAMIAMQIYVQLSLNLMQAWSLVSYSIS